MKKENIALDNSNKEFDEGILKLNNLKNTIENEMMEIDKRYEKADNDTTKSYEIKREKLKKEEDDLKEKLKTEVTKIKEQLENNLSKVNNLTKIFEKIKKGIKSLEKEENNIFKTLAYISNINKSQKELNNICQTSMKNLKINYIEDQSIIKYEEYYFNGIPVPKDITFKEIEFYNFKIFWNIEDNKLINIDKDKIKFNVEIRKENQNGQFKSIYEDSNANYLVKNLEKNTTYEIRISTIYNGGKSNWSEIKKVKTKGVDSTILNESERGDEFLKKLCEWSGYKKMDLLYRGTRDGATANIFHSKCDNQGPTICLCQNEKGNIFGGYASTSWTTPSKGQYKSASDSFIFTLTNIHGTNPTKYPNTNSSYSVYHGSSYFPVFGNGYDLSIYGDFLNGSESYAAIGNAYKDVLSKGNSIFSGDSNSGYFKLKEMEIFKV